LTQLATQLRGDVTGSSDPVKMRLLADAVSDLAKAR